MTVLSLPFPPSVNAMFADGRTRRIKSQKYVDWIMEAGWQLKRQRPPQIKGKVRLHYLVEDKRDGRKRDVGNYEKATTDLLVTHKVIEADDHTIVRGISLDWSDQVEGIQVTIVEAKEPNQGEVA